MARGKSKERGICATRSPEDSQNHGYIGDESFQYGIRQRGYLLKNAPCNQGRNLPVLLDTQITLKDFHEAQRRG